ncbi:MAG: hypothetical protein NC543_03875 [bacterium]|nr:hypothetical protein [bacterium]MCM1373802.1 hypothetical protein [Muribaculum sp.]
MNKVRFVANKDTNYVFHTLSVARCGYDNAYGDSYRREYPEEDLAVFQENEPLLTVCGGEHCGALHGLMVSVPARAETSATEYYAELIRRCDSGEVPENFKEYVDIVRRMSTVMIKHYDRYIDRIWPEEKKKIEAYIPRVQRYFEETGFTEKAEEMVGCKLPGDYFIATLVSSVENGAEAIDISEEQDMFGIERDPLDAFYFIGHEFIIYLLFEALRDEDAFGHFDNWGRTEGLAEYYLKRIMGDVRFYNSYQNYVEFYEKCEEHEKLSAVELYRRGAQV